MKFIEKIWLWKAYFVRGHSQYIMMPMTMFNFVVIQYELLVKQFGWFTSIFEFMVIVFVTYIPVASLFGRYDYKHPTGAVKVEQNLIKEISPVYKTIYKNQEEILENQEVLNNKLDGIRRKMEIID